MSKLTNTLYSCGVLKPLQEMLDKNRDVDVWSINMISLNALANKTGQILQYKSAIRKKYKLIKAEGDAITCGQPYSSSESDDETTEEKQNLNVSATKLPSDPTPVEEVLQKCGLLEPICKTINDGYKLTLWDIQLFSLEQIAKDSQQIWAFKNAVEVQWKRLKHNITTLTECNDDYTKTSQSEVQEDLVFQSSLDETAENPYLIQDRYLDDAGHDVKVEEKLKECGVLEQIKASLATGEEVSCLDISLITTEIIAQNSGLQKQFQMAVNRRARKRKATDDSLIKTSKQSDLNPAGSSQSEFSSSDWEKGSQPLFAGSGTTKCGCGHELKTKEERKIHNEICPLSFFHEKK